MKSIVLVMSSGKWLCIYVACFMARYQYVMCSFKPNKVLAVCNIALVIDNNVSQALSTREFSCGVYGGEKCCVNLNFFSVFLYYEIIE